MNNDINSLSGIEFEQLCKELLKKLGFIVETTKASGDGGIDLIASNTQPFLSGKYIVQCKRYAGSVGEPIIRDLYGVVCSERSNKGILMTTGTFTNSAIDFAEGKNIELIDGQKLFTMLNQYNVSFNNISEHNDGEDEIEKKLKFYNFKFDEYVKLKNNLVLQPTDNKSRAKTILILLELLYKSSVSNMTNDYSQKPLCEVLMQHINKYVEYSKKTDTLEIMLLSLSSQISFYIGDFVSAYSKFVNIANLPVFSKKSKYVITSGIEDILFDAITNIVKICCISKMINKAEQIIISYDTMIRRKANRSQMGEIFNDFFGNSVNNVEQYYDKRYSDFKNNIISSNKWLAISSTDLSKAIDTVYDIGDFKYKRGEEYYLNVDEVNDCLHITGNAQKIIIVKNISKSISNFQEYMTI